MRPDAQTFIDALHRLEDTREVDALAGLFAPDATISNPLVSQGGRGGAAAFWTAYRDTFDRIESTFSLVFEREDAIALEWRSTGTAKGRELAYEGVSMMEVGDAGVTAFRTYFDSARLGRELAGEA